MSGPTRLRVRRRSRAVIAPSSAGAPQGRAHRPSRAGGGGRPRPAAGPAAPWSCAPPPPPPPRSGSRRAARCAPSARTSAAPNPQARRSGRGRGGPPPPSGPALVRPGVQVRSATPTGAFVMNAPPPAAEPCVLLSVPPGLAPGCPVPPTLVVRQRGVRLRSAGGAGHPVRPRCESIAMQRRAGRNGPKSQHVRDAIPGQRAAEESRDPGQPPWIVDPPSTSGTLHVRVVPVPASDSTTSSPPWPAARSRMLCSPLSRTSAACRARRRRRSPRACRGRRPPSPPPSRRARAC